MQGKLDMVSPQARHDCHQKWACYFGAHKSYNSLSAGSKQVTRVGSARIMILRAGVSRLKVLPLCNVESEKGDWVEEKAREPLEMVEDEGDISPGIGVPCLMLGVSPAKHYEWERTTSLRRRFRMLFSGVTGSFWARPRSANAWITTRYYKNQQISLPGEPGGVVSLVEEVITTRAIWLSVSIYLQVQQETLERHKEKAWRDRRDALITARSVTSQTPLVWRLLNRLNKSMFVTPIHHEHL